MPTERDCCDKTDEKGHFHARTDAQTRKVISDGRTDVLVELVEKVDGVMPAQPHFLEKRSITYGTYGMVLSRRSPPPHNPPLLLSHLMMG